MPKTRVNIIWWAGIVASFSVALFLIVYFSLPYSAAKQFLDHLVPDGDFESFTLQVFSTLRFLQWFGWFILVGTCVAVLARNNLKKYMVMGLDVFSGFWQKFLNDFKNLLEDILPSNLTRVEIVALGCILLFGMVYRAGFLSSPMGHDEAYTVVAFASRPLRYVLMDYHLPNNHVFHTLLVHVAYHLFGDAPWIVRLPAFFASVFLILIGFLVGRMLFGRGAAILGASFLALHPRLVAYAAQARGYSITCVQTLVLLGLAVYFKNHKNRTAWFLFALVASLGFYTIPLMLYPFGAIMIWLLLSWMRGDVDEAYGQEFLGYLFGVGFLVVFLTILLYTPIFFYSGVDSVIRNGFVEPLSWQEFFPSVIARAKNTWANWNLHVPSVIRWVLVFGTAISVFFHKKISRERIFFPAILIAWIGLLLVWQRIAPWPRIWLFLLPIFLIWSAAGIMYLYESAKSWRVGGGNIAMFLILVLVVAWSIASMQRLYIGYSSGPGVLEQITYFLEDYLQPEDVVVVSPPDDAALWYYFDYQDIPDDYFFRGENVPSQDAVVVVNKAENQTLLEVLHRRDFPVTLFDLDTASVIKEQGRIVLYQLRRK